MNSYAFGDFVRVEKRIAKSLYNKGNEVIICACNLDPKVYGVKVSKDSKDEKAFEKLVNEFEYYNCTNTETGKYAAFYAKKAVGWN